MRPAKPCAEATCPELVRGAARCARHARKPFAGAQRSSNLYSTARWKRERAQHLRDEPNCRDCGAIASVVDHEPPHRGDEAAFFDRRRYRSLCTRHSNAKTGREVAARR